MEQKTLSIVARAKAEGTSELKKMQDAVDDMSSKVNKSTDGWDKFGAGMDKAGEKMVGVGKGMSLGITAPIVALGVATIGALQQVEVLGAQTDAVLKSTGNAANTTREHIVGMAEELEALTGVEMEAVQTGQNMLLTFTNIKNGVGAGNDIFDQSTKIMLDMATAMNGGVVPSQEAMKAQAIQLGKALNDPMKGLTALSKVGVSFTEDQKKQIQTMQEAGDTMGAQKVILAELNKEFGGSAEAFGATTAGKVAKLKNEFGNMSETLMAGALPAINSLVGSLTKLLDKFKGMTPEQQKMVGVAVAIAAALGPVLIIIGKMAQGVTAVIKTVKFLGNSFVGTAVKATASALKTGAVWLAQGVKMAASAAMTGAAHVGAALAAAAAWIAANAVMLLGIGLIIAAVVGLVIVIVKNWDTIKNAVAAAWNWIKDAAMTVFEALKTAISWYINVYISIFQWIIAAVQAVWDGIKTAAEVVFNAIKGVIEWYINAYIAIFTWIKDAALATWDAIGDAVMWVWENVISKVIDFYKRGFQGVWDTVVNVFNSVKNFVTNTFNTIKDAVSNVFGGIGNAITSPFKAAFNAVAGFWNNSIGKLSFQAPDWVPGLGGKGFSMPKLPMLAMGGIVTGPTQAIIGEGREPEAVLPLSKLDSMLENAQGNNQNNGPSEIKVEVHVHGNVIGDESSLAKLAIIIGQKLDQQLRAQGTSNVNLLRVTRI